MRSVSLFGMPLPFRRSTRPFLVIMACAKTVMSEPLDQAGASRSGLAAIHRVPMVATTDSRLVASADAGYGLTERQRSEANHHRFSGTMALGFVARPGLEFSALGAIRHDIHPNDGYGADSGTIGQLSLVTRWGTSLGSTLRIGADLGATFAGSEKLTDSLKSPALDCRALVSWVPAQGVRYAGFAGFRFDQSAGVGDDASRYRPGDRLALGLSDFNAILVGTGAIIPLGRFELLGELSGDLLVGAAAPSLAQSPLRVDAGLRRLISRSLQAELLTEVALSARPGIAPSAPLIPVEPRFSVWLGVRYALWEPRSRAVPVQGRVAIAGEPPRASLPAAATQELPKASNPAVGQLVVTVLDPVNNPLSDAVITLKQGDMTRALEFESGATFRAAAIPIGRSHLTVHADLMRDWEQDVDIVDDHPVDLRIRMVAAEASGQVRGLVRAFDGTRLPAHVHIDPGNHDAIADSHGAFSVDVSPGKYRVTVSLDGYQSQERVVELGKGGVMVLNVDLQKGPK